jgi:hypothetical protein
MQRFSGKIIDEAGTVIDGIEGTYSVHHGEPLLSWSGTITLPASARIMPGAFQLALNDGREARILVKKALLHPPGGAVPFLGNGPPPA